MNEEKLRAHKRSKKTERRDWVPDSKLGEIPLTGLARKILMRLDVLAKPREVRQGKALPSRASDFL